jgi:cellulose synthase/poly-beta-1,6-N-acetylglucosamine synthase-like glycosyltransferase
MLLDAIGIILVIGFLSICFWSLYNIPILVMGIRDFLRNKKKSHAPQEASYLPSFSIVLPVKNEETVISSVLTELSKLNYPENKREIIIVEDGSTDKTLEICSSYAENHAGFRVFHREFSNGKPSALNYGLSHATGEIVAVFDADSIPDSNALFTAAGHFRDKKVDAIQGKTLSGNSTKNMLTRFASYEETVWCEVYLRGKDLLNLFVHLKGNCEFIRREVLVSVKGFDENTLCEDMELSAKLLDNGYNIKYASDVVALQESPSTLKNLFRQRTRWLRGTMEVAFKYGRLMTKLNKKNFDAETTFFAPFLLIASLLPYLGVLFSFLVVPFSLWWNILVLLATISTAVSLLVCGFALIIASKPRKVKSLLWVPFIYFYWSFQSLIALYALILIILRRPKKWNKTDKTGELGLGLSRTFVALGQNQEKNLNLRFE